MQFTSPVWPAGRAAACWSPRPVRQWLAAVLATLILQPLSAGAEDGPSNALSPQALVARVLAENAGLDALRAAVDAAEARVVSAGALPDPEVSVDVAPRTVGGFDLPTGDTGSARVSWSVRQALPWPGTLGLRAERARKRAQAARESVAALRLRLGAATKSAYAEWRYVHTALAVNAANRDLLDELRSIAEQRYAAGLSGQQGVLQAEVELQRLERQALELHRLRRAVRAKINALLNRSANEPVAEPGALPPAETPAPYSVLRDLALSGHPELAHIQRRIAANRDREALARKDFYPDFKLLTGSRSVMDPEEKRLYMGVGFNVPLGRAKYRARLDEAKADTLRLEDELAEQRAQLLRQLEEAHATAEETRQSIALYEDELVPLARENLSAARAEYGGGGGAFLDVLDAERTKLAVELNLARVRADHFIALAQLERWTAGETRATPASNPGGPSSEHDSHGAHP